MGEPALATGGWFRVDVNVPFAPFRNNRLSPLDAMAPDDVALIPSALRRIVLPSATIEFPFPAASIAIALPDSNDEITVSVVGDAAAVAAMPDARVVADRAAANLEAHTRPEPADPAETPVPPAVNVLERIVPNVVPRTSAPIALRSNMACSMSSVNVPVVVPVRIPVALS